MSCVNILPKQSIVTTQFVVGEIPTGLINCVNLDFETACEFVPSTLEVMLDGNVLLRNIDYSINANNKNITLILRPDESDGLNSPPESTETITVNYIKAPGANCVLII